MENLSALSDDDLFRRLHELVVTQRTCVARLIVHLAELDARRAHLDQGFSSLFVYCVERLHFSEDEACRRIDAARLSRQYPEVIELLRGGAVSLTALGIVKPHLTAQNRAELFAGISGKSTRTTKEWLAARFPLPDVTSSLRRLPPGAQRQKAGLGSGAGSGAISVSGSGAASGAEAGAASGSTAQPGAAVAMGRRGAIEPLSADRFALRVTVGRGTRDAIELARDLMRHRNPGGDLEAVIDLAMRGLVERLEKEKLGRTTRRMKSKSSRRGHITRSTRREVVERDGLGCSWVGPDGHRCGSRAFLEFDHTEPEALGGDGRPERVRLLCRAHNYRAAEAVFGAEHMRRKAQRIE